MMRLRSRFESILKERAVEYLPAALETVWDSIGVTAAIESLKFTSTGDFIKVDGAAGDDWELKAEFTGVMRVELRADAVDTLVIEPMIADLVSNPVFLLIDPETQVDALSERARATLIELRDTVRDTQLVSALRFDVSGCIVRRAANEARPGLLISKVPEIGVGHEEDYEPIADDLIDQVIG